MRTSYDIAGACKLKVDSGRTAPARWPRSDLHQHPQQCEGFLIGLRPPLNYFDFVTVTVGREAWYLWRFDPLRLLRINESASQAELYSRPAPIRLGRGSTLLFCGLAAHATVHAETPERIVAASLEWGASTSGNTDTRAVQPSIIITAFDGHKIANDIDRGQGPARSIGSVDGTITPRRWTDHVASD